MFHGIRCGTPLFPFLCTLTTTTNVGSRGHVANKTILIVFLPHESSFSIDSPMSLPKAFSLGGIGYVRIKVKQKLDGHSVQVSCKKKRRNRFVGKAIIIEAVHDVKRCFWRIGWDNSDYMLPCICLSIWCQVILSRYRYFGLRIDIVVRVFGSRLRSHIFSVGIREVNVY